MPLFPSTTSVESTLDVYTGTTPHLALYTSNPTAADTGTEATSYTRQPITFGSTSGSARSNTSAITFTGLPTATITHYAIRTAVTGGTLLAFGPLSSSAASISGDQIQFAVGQVSIGLAGS